MLVKILKNWPNDTQENNVDYPKKKKRRSMGTKRNSLLHNTHSSDNQSESKIEIKLNFCDVVDRKQTCVCNYS